MPSRRVTLAIRTTSAVAALAAGLTLVLAGSGGAAAAGAVRARAVSPVVHGTNNSLLEAVTVAPRSTDAWAVVHTIVSSPYRSTFTVAHRHNNRWSKVAVRGRSHSTTDLRGIAAGSVKQIWAVGETVSTASVDTPLLERSNGRAFKIVHVAGLASGAHLSVVAASSPTNAWAMGALDAGSSSFALHWNGKKWTKSSLVVNGGLFVANGLSTSSPHNAWAVGTVDATSVIIHWNGRKWSVSATAPPGDSLNDIVSSGAHVWAVGIAEGAATQTPVALRLTSSGWRTVHLAHSPSGYFQAVAAVGSTAYAVGRTYPSTANDNQVAVLATLHGTAGAYGRLKRKGKSSAAQDIAASSKAVIAVGTDNPGAPCETPTAPLAEVLVHNKWKLSAIPATVAPASKTGRGLCG